MAIHTLPYSKTGYFSKLMCDYLAEEVALKDFYGRFPNLENFSKQLKEKQASFSPKSREVLVSALQEQYEATITSEATLRNIQSLSEANTFTITTGHQLNLFTGPLYFLYKIFSVINLTEKLKEAYPNENFVPVYWMATEDHDFDEINYFNLFGKKVEWKREQGGAVGALSTEGLSELLKVLKIEFGESVNGLKLISLFSEAYTKHENLAAATRNLGNELFAAYGLVIVDGNDRALKREFTPYVRQELLESKSHTEINRTSSRLSALGYPQQVFPREINLFYLASGLRERIIEKDGKYYVNDTAIAFSRDEILDELEENPQHFSPNALLRPLYQEVILPNLCYIGGGGELAYWFQLKDYFKSVDIPFPVLLLRNSVLLVPSRTSEKLKKLDVEINALFLSRQDLEEKFTRQLSEIKIDFSKQKAHLIAQFEGLYHIAKLTDASFEGAVAAQEKKQLNGLVHLEKRLLKAQKRKLADQLRRLTALQSSLFPKESLQERHLNFSEFYLEYGDALLSELKLNLDPLVNEFTILEL
jgi:bacillithiol biosynthesis cysteine-adding enzyme BshC